jgi:NAD(P)H-hydrate repair Nnr-like enzyme with NAD(P)H-hydrate dehydratase domain
VLAGWLGVWLAAATAWPPADGGMADPAFGAACAAAWWHGHAGEQGAPGLPLRAGDLANAMSAALAAAVANADPADAAARA